MQYYGKNGTYQLAAQPMKSGGEGAIYTVEGRNDLVAKIYFKNAISEELPNKLTYMTNNAPDRSILSQIAWPQDILRDSSGTFVGFVMPKLSINVDLKDIYVYPPKKGVSITYEQKVIVAINICIVISAIHKAGYTFGDFNPMNIGVNLKTGHVAFLDTDSYHVYDKENRKLYRCGVCLNGYVAPELIQQCKGTDYLNAPLPTFTQETDKFALAIHIFKLLMNGFTPFNGIKETETVSSASPGIGNKAIEKDNYCFKPGNKPQSVATPDLSAFPPDIQYLFKRAFIDGRNNTEMRPSADEWYQALCDYKSSLVQCKRDTTHQYYVNNRTCPYCDAEERYAQSMGKNTGQMSFSQPVSVPTMPARPTYTPSSASSPYTTGKTTSTYVGTSTHTTTTSGRKSGNFKKNVIKSVIAIAVIAALFAFVIWPYMINPLLPNDDFNTPEIVQSYCYSSGKKDVILTITGCSQDGQVTATWEFIEDGNYGKINLAGQIVSKKNNGDLEIQWNQQTPEILPVGYTWTNEGNTSISKNYTSVKADSVTLSAGTNDKYTIQSASDLQKLSGSSGTYYLKNDIDMAGLNWTPIEGFTGILLGNGYTINNLTIDANASNVGFFGTLDGTVMNLNFENANVTVSGRNENIGILCGELSGIISDISVSGNVSADKSTNVAGISGYVSRTKSYIMQDLHNSAKVMGLSHVGGAFGMVNNYVSNGIDPEEMIFQSISNSGEVVAEEDYAAGIIAYIEGSATGFGGSMKATISECTNVGMITGRYYVGGVVGYGKGQKNSTIESCSNEAEINAEAYVGCIAGATEKYYIVDCNNRNSILNATGHYIDNGTKYAYVGGIVGYGICLEDCTNEIDIMYTGQGIYVGGLMGYLDLQPAVRSESGNYDTAEAYIKNLVNNGDVKGYSYVGGIIGGTTYYWDNGCYHVTATFEAIQNSGNISAGADYVGGIAGYLSGDVGGVGGSLSWCIYDSNNQGSVSGNANVGGLFGSFKNGRDSANAYARNQVTIDGCESTGSVSGNSQYGEIIGLDQIEK